MIAWGAGTSRRLRLPCSWSELSFAFLPVDGDFQRLSVFVCRRDPILAISSMQNTQLALTLEF